MQSDKAIRDVFKISRVTDAFHGRIVDAVLNRAREQLPRHDRLSCDIVLPGYRHTRCIQSYFDLVDECRPVITAFHVVFPGPNHLDELAAGFGDLYGFRNEVRGGRRPAAETAAEEDRIHGDLVWRES